MPLVALLLVLSAWPAAITDRSFVGGPAVATGQQFATPQDDPGFTMTEGRTP